MALESPGRLEFQEGHIQAKSADRNRGHACRSRTGSKPQLRDFVQMDNLIAPAPMSGHDEGESR
jgi:hypothetical protein